MSYLWSQDLPYVFHVESSSVAEMTAAVRRAIADELVAVVASEGEPASLVIAFGRLTHVCIDNEDNFPAEAVGKSGWDVGDLNTIIPRDPARRSTRTW